jgi:hypothetical protein
MLSDNKLFPDVLAAIPVLFVLPNLSRLMGMCTPWATLGTDVIRLVWLQKLPGRQEQSGVGTTLSK